MAPQQFKVAAEDEGKRLDKFLVKNIEELARNQAKRLIDQERVEVNGKPSSASHSLRKGEAVTVKSLRASASTDRGEFTEDDIEIIEDNKDFLVVNKPAGLIVHKAKYIEENTLVYLLLRKYPELKGVGEYEDRPGIVHRLDKEVSGLLVVAKHRDSFSHLKEQFEQRKVTKTYTCLVHGHPPQDQELIDFSLKRSSKTGKIVAISKKREHLYERVRSAQTEYEVIKYYKNYTLLKVRLYTGRTHQIRVHLKSKGVPIVGDGLYTTRKAKRVDQKTGWNRVFLVSDELGFYNPEGNFRSFQIELPKELKDFLDRLN